MAKTINLIIVDDLALVEPLTKRLGFESAEDLLAEAAGRREGIVDFLRTARQYMESYNDRLYYLLVDTDNLVVARNVGGWYHLSVAFKSVDLPPTLDVEFDRIMLATGFQRFVAKDRHAQVFGGWNDHANESQRFPLPEGGHVMINREDPATAHYFSPRLTMKPEYVFKSYIPDPNRPVFSWLMVDDVARLDEWAERLNIMNFKPLSDVLNEGLTGSESAMEATQRRKSNVAQIASSLTEDTAYYTIVPEVMLKAAMISYDYREVVFSESGLPTSMTFLPRNAAMITKDYFLSIRDKRGDNWSVHQKDIEHHDKGWFINAAYQFAVNTLGMMHLPQTYDEGMNSRLRDFGRGPATTIDDTWLREQLKDAGLPLDSNFFGHWTTPNNGIFSEETMRKLRESPLTKESSFSRDLFTEEQLKRMEDVIPDVFLADGSVSITVLSKYYASKAALIGPSTQRRSMKRLRGLGDIVPDSMRKIIDAMPGSSMLVMGQPHVYDRDPSAVVDDINKALVSALAGISPPKPPLVPSAVLDTINKYLDEVKDTPVTPFDDVQIEGGEDGLSFTVTFTTTDPVMKDLLLKAGAVAVPDVHNNDVAKSYPDDRRIDWDMISGADKPTPFPPKDPE